jgi:uncharacterized DUF497 family protein
MIKFNWNIDKNIKLKNERGISFDDIVFYIDNGNLIKIIENPNFEKYSNQKIFVFNINDYIYYVPFFETDNEIFLKTIIPSRKLTKKYLGKKS